MLRSLTLPSHEDVDCLIVGGGLSGQVVASELERRGLSYVLLEEEPQMGGSLLQWGGWCLAPEALNFREAAEWGFPWSRSFENWSADLEESSALLNISCAAPLRPEFIRAAQSLGWNLSGKRLSQSFHHLYRPLVSLQSRHPQRVGAVRCRYQVDSLQFNSGGLSHGVGALNLDSGALETWSARSVVLAAGPARTRALLASAQFEDPYGVRSRLGRQTSHHMAMGYALVQDRLSEEVLEAGDARPGAVVERFVNLPEGRRGRSSLRPYRGGFLMELRGPYWATELQARGELCLPSVDSNQIVYLIFCLGEALPREAQQGWVWNDEDRRMAEDMESGALQWAEALSPGSADFYPLQTGLEESRPMHPAGGCVEGEDPWTSVTSPQAEVHGLSGVFLADASTWPTGLDRYPSWALAAGALRLARRLD